MSSYKNRRNSVTVTKTDSDHYTYNGKLIPRELIEGSPDWAYIPPLPKDIWITSNNVYIPYDEITHQHWSNIYHSNSKILTQDAAMRTEIARLQIVKRFEGKILPFKPHVFFVTYDGVEITDLEAKIYRVLPKSDWSVDVKIAKQFVQGLSKPIPTTTWLRFSCPKKRDEYIRLNRPMYSEQDMIDAGLQKRTIKKVTKK